MTFNTINAILCCLSLEHEKKNQDDNAFKSASNFLPIKLIFGCSLLSSASQLIIPYWKVCSHLGWAMTGLPLYHVNYNMLIYLDVSQGVGVEAILPIPYISSPLLYSVGVLYISEGSFDLYVLLYVFK